MKFGDVFKIERENKGLSQNELAEKIGMSKSVISMYENGKRFPSFDALEVICDFFNVDSDYMLGKTPIRKQKTFDEFGNEYYFADEKSKEIAVLLHNNPRLRILMDAGRKASPEDLEFIIKMAERMNDDD